MEVFSLRLLSDAGGEPRLAVKQSPLTPKRLRPAQVLADLQLVYWPAAALRAELECDGLELIERAQGDGRLRELRRDGETLVAIHYDAADPWRARVRFEQRAWGYRYTVTTLELHQP
jgi:hypothetical protein